MSEKYFFFLKKRKVFVFFLWHVIKAQDSLCEEKQLHNPAVVPVHHFLSAPVCLSSLHIFSILVSTFNAADYDPWMLDATVLESPQPK